jgi:hypothetical protein
MRCNSNYFAIFLTQCTVCNGKIYIRISVAKDKFTLLGALIMRIARIKAFI